MSSIQKIRTNIEMMGECEYSFEDYTPSVCIVVDVNTKYKTKKCHLLNIASGNIAEIKVGEGFFDISPFKTLDVIQLYNLVEKPKKVEVIGPSEPFLTRVNDKFRRKILLKYKKYQDIYPVLKEIKENVNKNSQIDVIINVDPMDDY